MLQSNVKRGTLRELVAASAMTRDTIRQPHAVWFAGRSRIVKLLPMRQRTIAWLDSYSAQLTRQYFRQNETRIWDARRTLKDYEIRKTEAMCNQETSVILARVPIGQRVPDVKSGNVLIAEYVSIPLQATTRGSLACERMAKSVVTSILPLALNARHA